MLLWRNPLLGETEVLEHNLPKRAAENRATQIRLHGIVIGRTRFEKAMAHTVTQSKMHTDCDVQYCAGCREDVARAVRAGRTGQTRAALKQTTAVAI